MIASPAVMAENAQLESLVSELLAEGLLDEQFSQLMQLQDDTNPHFVAEVKIPAVTPAALDRAIWSACDASITASLLVYRRACYPDTPPRCNPGNYVPGSQDIVQISLVSLSNPNRESCVAPCACTSPSVRLLFISIPEPHRPHFQPACRPRACMHEIQ